MKINKCYVLLIEDYYRIYWDIYLGYLDCKFIIYEWYLILGFIYCNYIMYYYCFMYVLYII